MLIGVLRRSRTTGPRDLPFNYECRVLLRRDVLPQTNQRFTQHDFLETLRTFRDEWHRNEKFWVSVLFCELDDSSICSSRSISV
jgi:hypothetical protein